MVANSLLPGDRGERAHYDGNWVMRAATAQGRAILRERCAEPRCIPGACGCQGKILGYYQPGHITTHSPRPSQLAMECVLVG